MVEEIVEGAAFVVLWVIGDGGAGPGVVPLGYLIGVPYWCAAIEVADGVRGAPLGDVGGPGRWFYSAVCGAFFYSPEFSPGVAVGDDWLHAAFSVW